MLKERSKKEFDGIKKIEKQNEGKEITDERIYSNIGPGWGGGTKKTPRNTFVPRSFKPLWGNF